MAADGLQLGLFPFFSEGFISPLDDGLDMAMSVFLTWLVGWHWVFLPSIVMKLAPILDEAPTWTLAVLIATHNRQNHSARRESWSEAPESGFSLPAASIEEIRPSPTPAPPPAKNFFHHLNDLKRFDVF